MHGRTNSIAIYETDVQNDFSYRDGALFVHGFEKSGTQEPYGAESRLPNVLALHRWASKQGHIILGSVDRHFFADAELIRNEGGAFDDHCMNGTRGQLRIDGLEQELDVYVRSKDGPGLGQRSYSEDEMNEMVSVAINDGAQIIFEKQTYYVGGNPNVRRILQRFIEEGLKVIAIDGFATDYCCLAAGLEIVDAVRSLGLVPGEDVHLFIVTDAIAPVNIDLEGNMDMAFGSKALETLHGAGVLPITTERILSGELERIAESVEGQRREPEWSAETARGQRREPEWSGESVEGQRRGPEWIANTVGGE